jgi:hypothetical protein
MENKATNGNKNTQLNFEQGQPIKNRSEENRRREPSEGFTYISSVGWIDRRETSRRKDDPYGF